MYQFADVMLCGVLEEAKQSPMQNGKVAVRGRVKVTKTFNGQSYTGTYTVEGWDEVGMALLSSPVGGLVCARGELKNEKYLDKATGQEKWATKVRLTAVGAVPLPPEHRAAAAGQSLGADVPF